MARLIDADALIEYIKIWEVGTGIGADQKEFIEAVNNQPTAYDVGKVIERLEDECAVFEIDIVAAKRIVREGGVK